MSDKDALEALRDQLAYALHEQAHGRSDTDSPTQPCWWAWRPQADALLPIIRPHLIGAWDQGVSVAIKLRLPRKYSLRNPYRDHGSACSCQHCYVAAMGGGR